LWAFKADASPSAPPFAPSYTFTARKTGSATSLIAGPQSASTASFDLDEGPWTISVLVDWGDDCPSVECPDARIIVREPGAEVLFRRGDSNTDGALNITDAIHILGFLFLGDADPTCLAAADVDDTGTLNLTDPVYLLGYLFGGGSEPPPPHGSCGADPTPNGAGCASYPPSACAN